MTTPDDDVAEEKAALLRLVAQYDLRSERNPSRPYDLACAVSRKPAKGERPAAWRGRASVPCAARATPALRGDLVRARGTIVWKCTLRLSARSRSAGPR
jgi:hypothetical protein